MKPETNNPLTLKDCEELFKKLQDMYYEEYKIYELSAAAIALVVPLVRNLSLIIVNCW